MLQTKEEKEDLAHSLSKLIIKYWLKNANMLNEARNLK